MAREYVETLPTLLHIALLILVGHCLDFIRQRLMCSVDVGVFGSVWVNKTDPKVSLAFFKLASDPGQTHRVKCDDRQVSFCTLTTLGCVSGLSAPGSYKSNSSPLSLHISSIRINLTNTFKPFVDFNTDHTCRDFQAVREWAKEHQQAKDEDLPEDWILPPDDDMNILDLAP